MKISADYPPGGKERCAGRELKEQADDLAQSIHPACYG
jgi:hypothetical protein